tara:strand:- start:47 stop:670 length:624 start_codon:yes stop_codon:yes gene_type:complete
MKENNFISIYDNAISSEECKFIIDYHDGDDNLLSIRERGKTLSNSVHKEWKDSYDRYMTMFIEGAYQANPINNIIATSINKYIEKYKEENPEINLLDRWVVRDTYNLQKYNPGGGYHILHCENYNTGKHRTNILAWMYYLNTVKEGGGTYFSNFDLTLDAVEGRLVIWPAYWTHFHKGIVSKKFKKYIATGWFCLANSSVYPAERVD